MNIKAHIALLVLSTGLAHAGVTLQKVGGTSAHTIKITGSVLKEDLKKFQQVLDEVERKRHPKK